MTHEFKIGDLVNIKYCVDPVKYPDNRYFWQIDAKGVTKYYGKVISISSDSIELELYQENTGKLYYTPRRTEAYHNACWSFSVEDLLPRGINLKNPFPKDIDYNNMIPDNVLKELM